MTNNNVSGANVSGAVTSGSVIVDNPFVLAISGAIPLGYMTSSAALVYCSEGAEISWVESKED